MYMYNKTLVRFGRSLPVEALGLVGRQILLELAEGVLYSPAEPLHLPQQRLLEALRPLHRSSRTTSASDAVFTAALFTGDAGDAV